MHRLVAYAHNGVKRFNIDRPQMVIGNAEECDIQLPYAGVAAEHARLSSAGEALFIEDLGSRRGVLVNGQRVREAELQVLDEVRLGSLALLVEDVVQEPREGEAEAADQPPQPVTITPVKMLEHLASISQWVLADAGATTLESRVTLLVDDFGGGVIFLFQGPVEKGAIKFVVASDARWLGCGEELLRQIDAAGPGASAESAAASVLGTLGGEPAWIAYQSFRAFGRQRLVVAAFPRFRPSWWSPLAALRTLGDLLILGLVHHVGQFEPLLLSQPRQSDLILAPGLVVGQSPAMQRVLAELRAVVDPGVDVLLRGKAGVSKELLARSLHISGPRKDGPFVTASCRGAKPVQVEADLFGSELAGKAGTVVREGKLLAADGGTLFLDDVEYLPLELQDRLMRFLRSADVEPIDSLTGTRVDVRLVAASESPLEAYVARDQMRIDLAYRLSQFAVDVPALRQRREDLPMLIQAAVNRCCHETGKRIQGITVKALEALAVYDYPGNLPELENIVRRLVYLCPSGQPIDESMLPEAIRLARIQGPRPTASSELNLVALTADCERAAILEALRRSKGNKSQAARVLGLSRNGLAMKIQRLGLGS